MVAVPKMVHVLHAELEVEFEAFASTLEMPIRDKYRLSGAMFLYAVLDYCKPTGAYVMLD